MVSPSVGCSTAPFEANSGCRSTSAPTTIRSIGSTSGKPICVFWRSRKSSPSLRPPVPSIRGKANRDSSTRIFGSHVVLDGGRSSKQAAGFQDLLQQPSHAHLTGRANAGYGCGPTSGKSPLGSMATPLSILVSHPNGCVIFQRLSIAAVSGQPLGKLPIKSSDVCVLDCCALRGSDGFTAAISIRQGHAMGLGFCGNGSGRSCDQSGRDRDAVKRGRK
jgi:hypothetical protein